MKSAFEVFSTPRNLLLAAVGAVVFFSLLAFGADLVPIFLTAIGEGIPADEKLRTLAWMISFKTTNDPLIPLKALISVLFAVNAVYITYYLKRRRAGVNSLVSAVQAGGLGAALLGLLCLSCGSLLAAFLASAFGAASLVAFLPQAQGWLYAVSAALLLVSIVMMSVKIAEPFPS